MKLIFLSRIVPKKNLLCAIDALAHFDPPASLTIAGPQEDTAYWERCRVAISKLGPNKTIEYVGLVRPDDVVDMFAAHDLFVFPTLGENFGHVIVESLTAGTPIILGRDTPFSDLLDGRAGWSCDPANVETVVSSLNSFHSMNKLQRERLRKSTSRLSQELAVNDADVASNARMFLSVPLAESSES